MSKPFQELRYKMSDSSRLESDKMKSLLKSVYFCEKHGTVWYGQFPNYILAEFCQTCLHDKLIELGLKKLSQKLMPVSKITA
ncbi:MAG TPA: hypothetical protein VNW29_01605 [Candidatus Sulfotelmatobacter sp.]|jgi:hypothetical protein|nr:hypothetical protein [Candidatus Sulfotelmatobacter sp.]